MQFILSATIEFYLENFSVNASAFHIDMLHPPRMIVRQPENKNIYTYSFKVFEKIPQFIPIAPTYPLQFQIIDKINFCLTEYRISDSLKEKLMHFKDQVIQLAPILPIKLNQYQELVKQLKSIEAILEKIALKPKDYKEDLSTINAIQLIFTTLLKELPNNLEQFDFTLEDLNKSKSICAMM